MFLVHCLVYYRLYHRRGLRHCLFCIKGNARAFIRGIGKVADSRASFIMCLLNGNNNINNRHYEEKGIIGFDCFAGDVAKCFCLRFLRCFTKRAYIVLFN